MIVALAALTFAQSETADMAVSCADSLQAARIIPADRSEGVPTDVQPIFIFETQQCGGSSQWNLSLEEADGGVVATSTATEADIISGIVRLPTANLQPRTEYVARAAAGEGSYYYYYYSQPISSAFTTGDEPTTPISADPIVDVSFRYIARDEILETTLDITPAPDATGNGAIAILHAGMLDVKPITADLTGLEYVDEFFSNPRDSEVCITVTQSDAAGNEREVDVCEPAEIVRGNPDGYGKIQCGTTAGAGSVMAAGLAMLLARRRRSQR